MHGNRLRWGALSWLLTLQFFVVETIAQFRFDGRYSRGRDVISDLGALASSTHELMNASFVVQGALILAGVVLLLPELRRRPGRPAQALLAAAGVGVVLVGVFPEDGRQHAVHATGAVLYFVGSALGLIALAYAFRPHSELIGTVLAVLGLLGAVGTIFFLDAITEYLGEGGTERVAAYVLPVGLALAGAAAWRMAGGAGVLPETGSGRPTRQELRARARAERAERERERDEALEAAAARRSAGVAPGHPGPLPERDDPRTGTGAIDDPELDDEIDPEDPWAPRARRRG